jgi:L-fucose isomerase-like protein
LEEIAGILAIIFVIGVPSLALATHVVVRPLLREYVRMKGLKADKVEVEARIAQLEDVVNDIDRQVNRLLEAERFRRELETGQRRSLPDADY